MTTTEAWDVTWDVTWAWDNFTDGWDNDSSVPTTETLTTEVIIKPPDTPPITGTRFAMAVLLSLIIPVSLFGNSVVLAAILRTRSLQRPNTMMYISLSVSDFLRTVFCMPIYAYSLFTNQWGIPEELCPFYHSFYIMLRFVTVLNLSVISIERLVIITKPLTYQRLASKTRIFKLIVFIWSLSLAYGGLNILWFYGDDEPDNDDELPSRFTVNIPCRFVPALGFLIFDFFLTFIIPLVVMVSVYVKIFLVVQAQMTRIMANIGSNTSRGENMASQRSFRANSNSEDIIRARSDSVMSEVRYAEHLNRTFELGSEQSGRMNSTSEQSVVKNNGNNSDRNGCIQSELKYTECVKEDMATGTSAQEHGIQDSKNQNVLPEDSEIVISSAKECNEDAGRNSLDHQEYTSVTKRDSLSHIFAQEYNIRRKSLNQTSGSENNGNVSQSNDLHKPQGDSAKSSYNSLDLSRIVETNQPTEQYNQKDPEVDTFVKDAFQTEEFTLGVKKALNSPDKDSSYARIDHKATGQQDFELQRSGSESFLLQDMQIPINTGNGVKKRTIANQEASLTETVVAGGKGIPTIVVDSTYGSMESGADSLSSQDGLNNTIVVKKRPRASTAKSRREPHLHENKALKLSVAVIGTFMFCFAPYEITFVVERSCPTCVGDIAWMTVNTLAFLSAALNPFVYSLYSTEFRKAMRNLLCGCRKSNDLI